MYDLRAVRDTALEAALTAGNLLRRKFSQIREVRYKGPRDIVTDADEAAQTAIHKLITERFPDHAFLGEEGQPKFDPSTRHPLWIVDPLDGTSNYARQFPFFCVSIAFCDVGQPLVGVIYDPLRGEMYQAVRGQGALVRRGKSGPHRMHVSSTSDFGEALVGIDWSRAPQVRAQVMAGVSRVGPLCRSIRATGSAALALAYVAAGWQDAYVNLALAPWDVAAGSLLIEDSEGLITTPTGDPWTLANPAIAASNGELHDTLIEALGFADN